MKHHRKRIVAISVLVLSIHVAVICWFLNRENPLPPPKNDPLVVKTISLKTSEQVLTPKLSAGSPPKDPPPELTEPEKKTVTPIQGAKEKCPEVKKKIQKKVVSPKKAVPQPVIEPEKMPTKPSEKKQIPKTELKTSVKKEVEMTAREKILQKAKENSITLQTARDQFKLIEKPESFLAECVGVIQLSIDGLKETSSNENAAYYSMLAATLKQSLHLPDSEEVKLRLTLDTQGKVLQVETIESKSDFNKNYLEKCLKTLQFPPFGKNFQKEDKHSFTIKLTNDS